MAAGLSVERERQIKYRALRKIEHLLRAAGVSCAYKRYSVAYADALKGFSVYYIRLNASNGEVALLPCISLTVGNAEGTGTTERYDYLSFERGIARIKELFARKEAP